MSLSDRYDNALNQPSSGPRGGSQTEMNALQAIMTRRTAARLGGSEPPVEVLQKCLEAAMRAPDHGKLRPWRFILAGGEARHRLGEVLAEAYSAKNPNAPEADLQRERDKALRSPLVVVVAAKIHPNHPKIPEIEQALSAGAATQNLILALHAHGFGSMWKTGAAAYDPNVKAALGLEPHDLIVAFLHVGEMELAPPPLKPRDSSELVRVWS